MRRSASRRPSLLALALLLSLPWLPAQAQETETQNEIFFDTVDVNVVNVEVFVTDRQNRPVQGLTLDDFELLEDGKPVEITNFQSITSDRELRPWNRDEPGPLEEPKRSDPHTVPQDQRLHVVLFVDNLNTRPKERNQVLDHLRRFLRESLDNQDRVMLVSFDGTLQVHQEFTSVPELIQPMFANLEKGGTRTDAQILQRQILRDIEDANLDIGIGNNSRSQETSRLVAEEILSAIRAYSQQMQDRTRFTLESMGSLVDSLAGLQGRKALLYVSGGMPLRPGETLIEAWDNKFRALSDQIGVGSPSSEAMSYDSTKEFAALVNRANANRVILYTIDAQGSRGFGAVSAEISGFDPSALGSPGGGMTYTTDMDSRQTSNYRSTLQFMAASTGGLAFNNSRGLGNTLSRLANDFNLYYSLGYRPDREPDGKYHRLKVRIKDRDGLRIRHRTGFQDKTSEERMSDRTLSALLLNVSNNPLGIALERGPGKELDEGRRPVYEIPILVKVPLGNLALLPDQSFHQGQISVFIAVRGSNGATSKVQKVPVPIKIPNDKFNQAIEQYAGYSFNIKMLEGFQRVAIGVRDEVASVNSTVRLNFRVGG